MPENKKYKKGEVTFRKIRGRIVPIRKKAGKAGKEISRRVKKARRTRKDMEENKWAIKSKVGVGSFTVGTGLGALGGSSRYFMDQTDKIILRSALNPRTKTRTITSLTRLSKINRKIFKISPKLEAIGFTLQGIGLAAEAGTRLLGK